MAGVVSSQAVVKPAGETPDGKNLSPFFTAVRERGLMNSILDTLSSRYEASHPDMSTHWEYCPTTGDRSMVTAREAMGYHIVDASEISGLTASEAKTGPLRRGDLILMAAPKDLVNQLRAMDADAASQDSKMSELTYREHLRGLSVTTKDGSVIETRAIGTVKRTTEPLLPSRGGE